MVCLLHTPKHWHRHCFISQIAEKAIEDLSSKLTTKLLRGLSTFSDMYSKLSVFEFSTGDLNYYTASISNVSPF